MRQQAAVIGILVAAAAVVIVASQVGRDRTERQPARSDGDGTVRIVQTRPGARVVLEAESAALNGRIEPPVSVREGVEGASKGACCYIGPEKVNESPATAQYEKGYAQAACPGFARLPFTVPETRNYRVWLRVRWSDDCGDSLDVVINETFLGTVQGNANAEDPRWMWLPLGTAADPITVHLQTGRPHTLTLANREDDLWFDQILLVGADQAVEPVGILQP